MPLQADTKSVSKRACFEEAILN